MEGQPQENPRGTNKPNPDSWTEAGYEEARKIPWQVERGNWDKIIEQSQMIWTIYSQLLNHKVLCSLTKDT